MWKPVLGTSLAVVAGWVASVDLGAAQEGPNSGRRPHAPRWVQTLDVNHDGKLDKEEIAKASERIQELDDNGDGELTAAELMPDGVRGPHGRDEVENREGGHFGPPRGERGGRPQSERDARHEMGPERRGFGPPWMRPEFGRPEFGVGRSGSREVQGPEAGGRGERGFLRGPGMGMRQGDRPMPPMPPGPPRFEDLDNDGDGVVSREEFNKARPPQGPSRRGQGPGGFGPRGPEPGMRPGARFDRARVGRPPHHEGEKGQHEGEKQAADLNEDSGDVQPVESDAANE